MDFDKASFSFWNECYRFVPNSKFQSAREDREMYERVEQKGCYLQTKASYRSLLKPKSLEPTTTFTAIYFVEMEQATGSPIPTPGPRVVPASVISGPSSATTSSTQPSTANPTAANLSTQLSTAANPIVATPDTQPSTANPTAATPSTRPTMFIASL